MSIRVCTAQDIGTILEIVNDAALAYRGTIPDDLYREPYMAADELGLEIAADVDFWGIEAAGGLAGVMGLQELGEVSLIRHAYVRTSMQGRGLGGKLLAHLRGLTDQPLLVGTWAAAEPAIGFYRRHGFEVAPADVTRTLLRQYWSIPERQLETSIVLRETARAFSV